MEGLKLLPRFKGVSALAIASVSFGTSAILIRYATEVTALSLAFFRLLIAAVVMMIFVCSTRSLVRKLTATEAFFVIMSGVMLSLHFAAFIFAVKFTTVANATFLVNTSPVMLAVLSPVLIKERTTSREGVGVLAATLGVLLVADVGNGFRAFSYADISALVAAAFLSLYSLIGRYLRLRGMSTASYTAYVYSIATILALFLAETLGSKPFQTYDTTNIIAIVGLALVPTTIGHTLYNYSLGSVKAVTANLFPLLEPILASAFAVLLFGEIPTLVQIVGYLLILFAVVIVVTGSSVEQQTKALC